VSSTLDRVDWNAELVRGDLEKAVQQLKRESRRHRALGKVYPRRSARRNLRPLDRASRAALRRSFALRDKRAP
jgi:hypothetical protein